VFPTGGEGGNTTASGSVGAVTGLGANVETGGGAAHAECLCGENNIVTATSHIADQTANRRPAVEGVGRIR
jgi:hypothetical protein